MPRRRQYRHPTTSTGNRWPAQPQRPSKYGPWHRAALLADQTAAELAARLSAHCAPCPRRNTTLRTALDEAGVKGHTALTLWCLVPRFRVQRGRGSPATQPALRNAGRCWRPLRAAIRADEGNSQALCTSAAPC